MAGLIFTMTDTAAACGEDIMCSGASNLVGQGGMDSEAVDGGTAGTTEQTVKHSASVTSVASCFVQMAPPTDTDWDSGDWIIRLDVTTGNSNITWQEAHICHIDGACNSLASLASVTGLGTTLSAGIYSATATQGSIITPSLNDEIYIVYVFDFGGNHGNEQVGITPSQNIDSPIETISAGSVFKTSTAVKQTIATAINETQ